MIHLASEVICGDGKIKMARLFMIRVLLAIVCRLSVCGQKHLERRAFLQGPFGIKLITG